MPISLFHTRRPGARAPWLLASIALLWLVSGAMAPLHAQPEATPQHAPAADVKPGEAAQGHTAETEHEGGILPVVARLTNFLILVGLLTYFLRTPLQTYLASRSEQIGSALVRAAEMKRTAEAELASIDQRMKALPSEIESLRARGAEELAAEESRIRAAAEAERARLLDHMRRELDLQVRIARRELMEEAATLAVGVARKRIESRITPDDQIRLIDRYATQLRSAS